jgi:hypothetical protein
MRRVLASLAVLLAPAAGCFPDYEVARDAGAADGSTLDATVDGDATPAEAAPPVDAGAEAAPMPCDGCVLAIDGGQPLGIALDDAGVVFITFPGTAEVWRVGIDGSEATRLAQQSKVFGIAVDDTYVAWGGDNVVVASKANVGSTRTLDGTPGAALRIRSGVLYYPDNTADGGLHAYPLGSSGASTLATGLPPVDDLVVDDGFVYTASQSAGVVTRIPLDAGALRTVSASGAFRLALDSAFLYVVSGQGIGTVSLASFEDAAAPAPLVSSNEISAIATYGGNLYYAKTVAGELWRADPANGQSTPIPGTCDGPHALVVNASWVLATCSNSGVVVRAPNQ